MNTHILNSKSRRQGQALLMAVLIMIFVVLLGTTFIAIVASNMSNTARTGSKDAARQAAKAGIEFADSQLTDSAEGLSWRPTLPTTPGSYYYSSIDRAQGWNQQFFTSQTGSSALASFVKYPTPQGTAPSSVNTSNFMIRVSQVQAGESDNADNTKTGDIRIESIGFAEDDPAAYYEIVAYKKGPASNPLTAAMRSVTNWDFNADTVPQGYIEITGSGTVGPTVTLTNAKGYFDPNDCPFYVTLTTAGTMNNVSAPQVAGTKVDSVTYNANGEPVLTFSGAINVTISGSKAMILVQKAAALGSPASVEFDNATVTPIDYRISGLSNPYGSINNTAGGVWINGGLLWFGTNPTTSAIPGFDGIKATNLLSPNAPAVLSGTAIASTIKVSGLFSSSIIPSTIQASVQVAGTTSSGALTAQLPADSTSTADNDPLITSGLVDDGLNRLSGSSSPVRQIKPFTPPDITAGGDGFGRYRQLTRYSAPANPADPLEASVYGYGEGIYINNPQDVEKVGSTPMTQSQLHDLWFKADDSGTTSGTLSSTAYLRKGEPAKPDSTTNSLEEQHMRGWVSPADFVPRGAEVIINNDNTITINLDPLADNSTAYPTANFTSSSFNPDPAKCWRDNNGVLLGDSGVGGVYSQRFNWPDNGTIFAEGNIRVRGTDANATKSLTVVSMNNIYIEGSIGLSNDHKVLLLAKKNVVVNPTQIVGPVQAATRLSGNTSTTSIDVYDARNFNVGDYFTFNYGGAPVRLITGVDHNSGEINFTPALSSVPAINTVVYTVFDPRTDAGYYSGANQDKPYNAAIRLARKTDVIQRRIWFDPNASIPDNLRLAFRHSAEYKKALTLQMDSDLATGKAVGTDPGQLAHTDVTLAAVTNKALENAYKGQSVITPGPDTNGNNQNKYLKVKYKENSYDANGALTTSVKTDIFPSDMDKANEGKYTTDPYPYQYNSGNSDDRQAAANVSLGHLYKQMLDRNFDVADKKYDTTHWRYGELTFADPSDLNSDVTGVNAAGAKIEDNYWTMTNGHNVIAENTPIGDFDIGNESNEKAPRAYFMASVGNRLRFNQTQPSAVAPDFGDGNTEIWPIRQQIYPSTDPAFTIPMATSVWLWMNNYQAILRDNTFNSVLNSFGNVLQFGFSPLLVNLDQNGNSIDSRANYSQYADWEDTLTSDQYFYQPRDITNGVGVEDVTKESEPGYIGYDYDSQRTYDIGDGVYKTNYTLDSRVLEGATPVYGDNEIGLMLNDALVDPATGRTVMDYFHAKATNNDLTADPIPYYRISNIKLQNETYDDSNGHMTDLQPATQININAYVYAQEGGWYVIPGTDFDLEAQNRTSTDPNYVKNDLNRDGVVSLDEQIAGYRYHRYNYQITFTGAIMENQTASVDDVDKWVDNWATVSLRSSSNPNATYDYTSNTVTPNSGYESDNPANANFNTILYYYDPVAATGALSTDTGFHPPAMPGLIYQG